MTFDLTASIARHPENRAFEMIQEACRLIAGCRDPHYRALAMIELRRMQAMLREMMAGSAFAR